MKKFEKRLFELLNPFQVGCDNGNFYLGVNSSSNTPVVEIPQRTTGYFFYLGASGHELIELFLSDGVYKRCETLFLGYANDEIRVPFSSISVQSMYDYSQVIKKAGQKRYPRLKRLILGEYELFFNGEHFTGYCGDVTQLLKNTPRLVELKIVGEFMLTEKISLKELKILEVYFEDYMVALKDSDSFNVSMSNLMQSTFPNLEKLIVYYHMEENPVSFTFPDLFLKGKTAPKLKHFQFYGEDNLLTFDVDALKESELVKKSEVRLILS